MADLKAYTGKTSSTTSSTKAAATTTKTVRQGYVDPMILPCNAEISQGYGHGVVTASGGEGFHTGVDFAVPRGTPFKAPYKGTVLYAGSAAGFTATVSQWLITSGGGNIVVLGHDGWTDMVYHLDAVKVSTGQTMSTGTVLGLVGSTGNSTGPHAHWDLVPDGTNWDNYQPPYGRVDPLKFREAFNDRKTTTTTTREWDEMATKDESKAAFREVLHEPIKRQGKGMKGSTSIVSMIAWMEANFRPLHETVDASLRKTTGLFDLYRLGIPARFTDGTLGAAIRKATGYTEKKFGTARQKAYDTEKKGGFKA